MADSSMKRFTATILNITPLDAYDENEAMVTLDAVIEPFPPSFGIGDTHTTLTMRFAPDDSIESLQASARSQLPRILREIADQLEEESGT